MARYLTINGLEVLDPAPLLDGAEANGTPRDFWGRANSFTCPRGMAPGSAWIVVPRATLNQLDPNSLHALEFVSEYDTLQIPSLVLVRAVCMGLDGDSKAAYLLEMQDPRRLLGMSEVHRSFNCRAPAGAYTGDTTDLYHVESLNEGSLWTWATLIESLWGQLPGIAGAAPALPFVPEPKPENLRFIGVSAWEALGQVLASIGCEIAYNPIQGTFSIVRLGQVQAGLAASLAALRARLIYDYQPLQDLDLATVPEKVRVFFHRREKHRGTEKEIPREENWEMLPARFVEVATGIAGAGGGTVQVLWDPLLAETGFDGSLLNETALTDRANERAADLVARLRLTDERMRQRYAGIASGVLPGSEVQCVVWRDLGDEHGQVTEIIKSPEALGPAGTAGQGGAGLGVAGEAFASPDLARHSHPVYPDYLQLLTASGDSPGDASGDPATPNASGLFAAKLTRTDPDLDTSDDAEAYSEEEDVWILPINRSLLVKKGDRFLGRLCGSKVVAADGRPLFLVAPAETEIIRFVTTETKVYTANVLGQELAYAGGYSAAGPALGLVDSLSIFGPAPAGAQGWAYFANDRPLVTIDGTEYRAYEILFMEGLARFIRGTVLDDVATSAPATVGSYWGDATNGIDPGSTVIALTPPGLPDGVIKSGSAFIGVLDETLSTVAAPVYQIIWFDQEGNSVIRFQTSADKAYGADVAGLVVSWDGDSYETGDVVNLIDAVGRFGPSNSGANGYAVHFRDRDEYEIIWIEAKARYISGELNEDMGDTNAGKAECTVTSYWGNADNGQSPGSSIDVVDDQDRWPDALSGAKYRATLHESSDTYRFDLIELRKPTIEFELTTDLATADSSIVTDLIAQYGPGMDNPAATVTLINPETGTAGVYRFEGATGVRGTAVWDHGNEYLIIQMDCPE